MALAHRFSNYLSNFQQSHILKSPKVVTSDVTYTRSWKWEEGSVNSQSYSDEAHIIKGSEAAMKKESFVILEVKSIESKKKDTFSIESVGFCVLPIFMEGKLVVNQGAFQLPLLASSPDLLEALGGNPIDLLKVQKAAKVFIGRSVFVKLFDMQVADFTPLRGLTTNIHVFLSSFVIIMVIDEHLNRFCIRFSSDYLVLFFYC